MNRTAHIAVAHAGAGIPCWRSPTTRAAAGRAPSPRSPTTTNPEDQTLVIEDFFVVFMHKLGWSARSDDDAYGTRTITTATGTMLPKSTIGFDRGFTGYQLDAETNLYYARARIYAPVLGTFISRNAVGYLDGYSSYLALMGLKGYVDPTGLPGVGNHYVPLQLLDDLGINGAAGVIFKSATTGPSINHGWSAAHDAYTVIVRTQLEQYMAQQGVSAATLSAPQASEFVTQIRNSGNPFIKSFGSSEEFVAHNSAN